MYIGLDVVSIIFIMGLKKNRFMNNLPSDHHSQEGEGYNGIWSKKVTANTRLATWIDEI
jgi:plasmid maintenance system killer protein